jgi:alginate O-acetyltransferase complex protein AlgI
MDDFAEGIRRFVVGLAKKVLIANTLGTLVDRVFSTPGAHVATPLAWFALAAYGLQIYFDFSGYSDMAIGLARMFGFRLLENFNFPYVATSVQDFWRRWHISLSRWFRDYLYIPLGGNRVSPWRVYGNLVIVFFLCGLWHGAKWTFVVWGLIHGLFLVLERSARIRALIDRPLIRHVYVIGVVATAWVFFRADSFAYALAYLGALVHPVQSPVLTLAAVDHQTVITFVLGCFFATPLTARAVERALHTKFSEPYSVAVHAGLVLAVTTLFVASVAALASGTYNPFIYFRF